MQYDTELQNNQQLKKFDLSEYRVVIHEAIIFMYEVLIRQIQESIKPHIVPAILHHVCRVSNRGLRIKRW